ncbi:1064_t:CDS:2 [Cetraspora pellucida]|uniref:1064_t:CDS:1 n=1 Tax=Cetraspora pellucida TaxID=1433469 RepID=A0A9N9HU60_9GLOM|nr:1064_t:CDS:2 [Cetraspora pellucida]
MQQTRFPALILSGLLKLINSNEFKYDEYIYQKEIFENLKLDLDFTLESQKLVHLTEVPTELIVSEEMIKDLRITILNYYFDEIYIENFYSYDSIHEFSLEMRVSVILEDLRQKLLKKIVFDDTEPLDNFNYLVKKVEKELGLIRSKNTKNFRESVIKNKYKNIISDFIIDKIILVGRYGFNIEPDQGYSNPQVLIDYVLNKIIHTQIIPISLIQNRFDKDNHYEYHDAKTGLITVDVAATVLPSFTCKAGLAPRHIHTRIKSVGMNVFIDVHYDDIVRDWNYFKQKPNKKGNLRCGCSYEEIKKRIDELLEYYQNTSKHRRYHCCECKVILTIDNIYELEDNIFKYKGCYKNFHMGLNENDERRKEYIQSSEYQRYLVNCVVCKKEHKRAYYLDGIGDFCNIHHQVAYKVYQDIENPNKKLWIHIRHWTDTSKTRLSAYLMNQIAILRTVLIMKNLLNISYDEALKEQNGDFFNSAGTTDDNDWYEEDYTFERIVDNLISPEEMNEKERLRKLIIESFNFGSNIDIKDILTKLQKNYGSLKRITFCKSCWLVDLVERVKNNLCSKCNNDGNNDDTNNNEINNEEINNNDINVRINELMKQISEIKLESEKIKIENDKYRKPFVFLKQFLNSVNSINNDDDNLILL